MSKIKIETTFDTHECERCGVTYAEGAMIYIDDQLVIELEPIAYCFDGSSYDFHEVTTKLVEYLGHTLEIIEGT